MQAAVTPTNKTLSEKTKYVQVNQITNIQLQLEYLNGLYSIGESNVLANILNPCEYLIDNDEFLQENSHSEMVNSIYNSCALSILGDPSIFIINGAAGTGKSVFVVDLLRQFINENFQYTSTILVCGVSNHLVDNLALKLMSKMENISPASMPLGRFHYKQGMHEFYSFFFFKYFSSFW